MFLLLTGLPSEVHLIAALKYIVNSPDILWWKPQKARWSTAKNDLYVEDTGGSLEKHLSSMPTFIWPTAAQKENMNRKEIQSSILQIAIYIRKNGDGKKGNTKNRLADPEKNAKEALRKIVLQVMTSCWRCSLPCKKFGRIDRNRVDAQPYDFLPCLRLFS